MGTDTRLLSLQLQRHIRTKQSKGLHKVAHKKMKYKTAPIILTDDTDDSEVSSNINDVSEEGVINSYIRETAAIEAKDANTLMTQARRQKAARSMLERIRSLRT